jgi:hypothetical protein
LLYARSQCRGLGWRGEVACDAELLTQCQFLKGGRGKIDLEGVGIGAVVRAQARKTHDSIETIRLNIRIYKTFFETVVTRYDSLTDKGFFHAALRASNPLRAIEYFAEQFATDEAFNVVTAKQWVAAQREKRIASANKLSAAPSLQDKSMSAFLRKAIDTISQLKAQCPDKDFARRVFPSMIEDLEDQFLTIADRNAESLCCMAWERGYYREGQMTQFTGLSRQDVSMAMNRLDSAQEFYVVEEHTHGKHDRRWQKAGVPLVSDSSARKVG